MKKHIFYERVVKRIIDIIVSGIFLIFFSWLYLILYFVVRTKLGSPVLFKQDRPGYKGKVFKMYKYRSMTDERDENGELLPDEVRLTSFGKKLRSTSLDELPEMLNVFKGDMSLIGPRPLLVSYLPLYNERQSHRHDVRPGITGYAQAYGRNSITWEEKFEKDVYYVENCSFLLDLKIIFHTIKVVLNHEGISSATSATMEAFTGTKEDN
ncbi:MAG: sugar transferase [Butyrivibrio sp.]|jgi:lipopolysaccharide/colanic/teichoic acid biosynthesis glycosyltransferase|nr:sugar transferase [Butyrivibrio sp.]